jgi:hypothetical protein
MVWVMMVILAVAALAGAAPSGVIVAASGMAARPQSRAVAMGLFFTVFYAVGLAAPPLAGAVADASGDASLPIYMISGWLVLSLGCYGLFRWAMARGVSSSARE